jgi:hypothetical protein
MKRAIFFFVAWLGPLAACSEAVAETNRTDVQANIQKGYDKVVFGKEIGHKEYMTAVVALTASAASGSPTPLIAVIKNLVDESIAKLGDGVKRELVLEALRNPGKVFASGQQEISGGFATYEQWEIVKVEVPDKIEIKGFEVKVTMKVVTQRVQLPNTYQPYLRWKKK